MEKSGRNDIQPNWQNLRFSRRGVLRTTGLTAFAGAILVACGRPPSPQSAATSPSPTPPPESATPVAGAANVPPAVAAAAAAAIQQGAAALRGIDYSKIDLRTDPLAANLYALSGSPGVDPGHPEAAGGRVAILTGSDGVFMVDAQYAPLSDKVAAAIARVTRAPVRFLVNTHFHPDHTGGNAYFARRGALIFSREEERKALPQPLPGVITNSIDPAILNAYQAASGDWTDPSRLPVITYGAGTQQTVRLNGETIHLVPAPTSHTDGDTVVWFESADVMVVGDFYRNYGYPFVDPSHGGSTSGILAAVDLVSSLAGAKTKLLPGHGGIVAVADLPAYREMILTVQGRVKDLFDQGRSLQEVLDAKPTASYDAVVPGGTTPVPGIGSSADRFVTTIYTEAKAASSA
jgi:cyclase